MPQTLCERVAAPLLLLHRKTTSPVAVGVLAAVGLSIVGYGQSKGNPHVVWFGVLLTVVSWYGFLLSGCERLLTAKDKEILSLQNDKLNAD